VRTRTVIGAAAGVVVVAAVVAVAVPVVRNSDALTTEIRTAADSPPVPETGPLPAAVRQRWSAPTGTAGAPVEGSSAIATGPNRVAGLDPATGRERWSYERGNARLCATTLREGTVVALFAKSHGCRDLVGLDAGTGRRRWYRTLEVTTDATLASGPGVAVATAGDQMIAVDTGGGLNRWTWKAAGCRLDPAVAGQAAVATVARCGNGEIRLVMHSPYADKEPSVQNLPAGGDPRVLAAAERVVAVLSGAVLTTYGTSQDKDGKITVTKAGTVSDRRLAAARPAAVTDGDTLVLWTGTTAIGVDTRTRSVRWAAPATGPPALSEGQVLLAGADGFSSRPAATGTPVTSVATDAAAPAGAGLSRIGRLVLAAGGGRLVAYG